MAGVAERHSTGGRFSTVLQKCWRVEKRSSLKNWWLWELQKLQLLKKLKNLLTVVFISLDGATSTRNTFGSVNPVAFSHFNFSVHEPTGIVTIIAPESPSLLGLVSCVMPVIAGGNTCVVLASENSPHVAVTFAEVLNSSDVPDGVVNILTGKEDELVEHFSSHMDVNATIYCRDKHLELIKRKCITKCETRFRLEWQRLRNKEGEDPYVA